MKDKSNEETQLVNDKPVVIMRQIGESQREDDIDLPLDNLPVVSLADCPPFPQTGSAIVVHGDINTGIVSKAIEHNQFVFLTYTPENYEIPQASEMKRVGVVARIMHQIMGPDGQRHAFTEVMERAVVHRFSKKKNQEYRARIELLPYEMGKDDDMTIASAINLVIERFTRLLTVKHHPQKDQILEMLQQSLSPVMAVDTVINQMPLSDALKQTLLEIPTFKELIMTVLHHLDVTIQLSEIVSNIEEQTKADLTEQQRENFLQAQIRQMQQELGQGLDSDVEDLQKRADTFEWSDEIRAHFKRELNKLTRYNITSPDYSIQYSYLDRFLSLPWNRYSDDNFTLDTVEKVLNRDHFGLEKVKERILEQMAVIKLRNDIHAPILCLVGPPGVGKTSLGRSIADAMGREYQRISFGGMHDEAEIRGHRRTYIGAMPGRIITALEKCKTNNPVIVLDEIDKIGTDFKGDPSSALLEVLDPEQNNTFHDNYLDTDYDLSHILFIATANTLSTISAPLLDRMEIISLSGYITAEKVEIAKNHLIPKLLKEHGFKDKEVEFQRPALIYIIDYYTRESGVRKLEKVIAKLLRKIARLKVSDREFPTVIDRDTVSELLGKEEFNPDMYENNDYAGVVTGLAWTSAGGEILFIESSVTKGNDKLQLTGNLGDVMKESATIAVQYLKAHHDIIGLQPEDFENKNVHIHVPEGAIPKDGPSAGITMVTSVASALTGRKVRSHLAMTGEITLRGKVLPVGGIKEKIIAAKRAGIKEIILSKDNRKDIEEINDRYLKGLKFTYVEKIEDVLERALL
ncbi:MAG: endopeptidase La [Muribaculaceae bacterium]|nr:endopeptidase La [Muribaculaceae bacterium]